MGGQSTGPVEPVVLLGPTHASLTWRVPMNVYLDNGDEVLLQKCGLWLASAFGTPVVFAERRYAQVAGLVLTQFLSNHSAKHGAIRLLQNKHYIRYMTGSETIWCFTGGSLRQNLDVIKQQRYVQTLPSYIDTRTFFGLSRTHMGWTLNRAPDSECFPVSIYVSTEKPQCLRLLQVAFYHPRGGTFVIHDAETLRFLWSVFNATDPVQRGSFGWNLITQQGMVFRCIKDWAIDDAYSFLWPSHQSSSFLWVVGGTSVEDHCSSINVCRGRKEYKANLHKPQLTPFANKVVAPEPVKLVPRGRK